VRVLIVGANGQLGQDLMQTFGMEAIGLTHEDVDVRDAVSVISAVQSCRPDWVINTAAFHNVDECERNPSLAYAVNASGAGNVARAANEVGAGVTFISTDYVFGGEKRRRGNPHTELDATHPLNMYGVTKRAGERMVMTTNKRHMIIRTAGLFGLATSRKGWTFPELMITKANAGEHLRVVDDQTLSPTFTADLAVTIRELVNNQATGLFHVTNEGECSWYEFACAALQIAGVDATIEPVKTQHAPDRAKRPNYSALKSTRLITTQVSEIRSWKQALESYLNQKALVHAHR
jgi:dTDP-4-dehydrorhamnose reductase